MSIHLVEIHNAAEFNAIFKQVEANQKKFIGLTKELVASESVLLQAKLPLTLKIGIIQEKVNLLRAEVSHERKNSKCCDLIAYRLGFGSTAKNEKLAKELNAAVNVRTQWLQYASQQDVAEYALHAVIKQVAIKQVLGAK